MEIREMKPKKYYTVKCRIPVVAYTDIYLYATSKTQAKAKAKAFMNNDFILLNIMQPPLSSPFQTHEKE